MAEWIVIGIGILAIYTFIWWFAYDHQRFKAGSYKGLWESERQQNESLFKESVSLRFENIRLKTKGKKKNG